MMSGDVSLNVSFLKPIGLLVPGYGVPHEADGFSFNVVDRLGKDDDDAASLWLSGSNWLVFFAPVILLQKILPQVGGTNTEEHICISFYHHLIRCIKKQNITQDAV